MASGSCFATLVAVRNQSSRRMSCLSLWNLRLAKARLSLAVATISLSVTGSSFLFPSAVKRSFFDFGVFGVEGLGFKRSSWLRVLTSGRVLGKRGEKNKLVEE